MSSIATPRPIFRQRFARGLITIGLCLLWSLVVLYPNPTLLPRAIANAYDPKIDPDAVRTWADQLPDDPVYIEQQVEGALLPYAVPWETYGVPWYYPTTREVVEQGVADCQGRMLVFASILEAKGIPYRLRASFDHIWVEYPNKQETRIENAAIALMDDGSLQLPDQWDWRESYEIEKDYFWDAAPLSRKLLLLTGVAAIILRRRIVQTLQRRWIALASTRTSAIGQLTNTICVWEGEGRLSTAEAQELRTQLGSPHIAEVAPHFGAHVVMGMLLPFPLASMGRASWTLCMLLRASIGCITDRNDRRAWRKTWRIHHPLVAMLAAVPVIGSFAYVLATPLRGNQLFLRLVVDAGLSRLPWRVYERSGSRRLLTVGHPATVNRLQSATNESRTQDDLRPAGVADR